MHPLQSDTNYPVFNPANGFGLRETGRVGLLIYTFLKFNFSKILNFGKVAVGGNSLKYQ